MLNLGKSKEGSLIGSAAFQLEQALAIGKEHDGPLPIKDGQGNDIGKLTCTIGCLAAPARAAGGHQGGGGQIMGGRDARGRPARGGGQIDQAGEVGQGPPGGVPAALRPVGGVRHPSRVGSHPGLGKDG